MARPNRPTLLFPNGNEELVGRVVRVEWEEPAAATNDLSEVWYEIFYSEFYDPRDEPDWKKIAVVPSGNNTYDWKIGNQFNSSQVKVAIRSFNLRGERSEMSVSADLLSIRRESPPAPSVLSPVPNSRYGSSVEIAFDDSAIRNTFGQRAKYFIYFRSNKAGIPYTPIAQSVPTGSGPITWDTSTLPPSDDYVVTIYLADDDGNKSQETNINNLSIFNEGFFLIDTKPPTGFVQINNADQFTRETDVTVKLFAFDEITGIHSMKFIERTDGTDDNGNPASGDDIERAADAFAETKYYTFETGDGTKVLKVLFQDFAANRTSEIQIPFRIGFERDNQEIADVIVQRTVSGDVVWIGINEIEPGLYRLDDSGASVVLRTPEQIAALAILTDTVYIAVETEDNRALIYRDSGFGPATVIDLDDTDSQVLSMANYSGELYFGTIGGHLYRYDEAAINLVNTFSRPIEYLFSDGALLYIVLRNSTDFIVYDKAVFTEVSPS